MNIFHRIAAHCLTPLAFALPALCQTVVYADGSSDDLTASPLFDASLRSHVHFSIAFQGVVVDPSTGNFVSPDLRLAWRFLDSTGAPLTHTGAPAPGGWLGLRFPTTSPVATAFDRSTGLGLAQAAVPIHQQVRGSTFRYEGPPAGTAALEVAVGDKADLSVIAGVLEGALGGSQVAVDPQYPSHWVDFDSNSVPVGCEIVAYVASLENLSQPRSYDLVLDNPNVVRFDDNVYDPQVTRTVTIPAGSAMIEVALRAIGEGNFVASMEQSGAVVGRSEPGTVDASLAVDLASLLLNDGSVLPGSSLGIPDLSQYGPWDEGDYGFYLWKKCKQGKFVWDMDFQRQCGPCPSSGVNCNQSSNHAVLEPTKCVFALFATSCLISGSETVEGPAYGFSSTESIACGKSISVSFAGGISVQSAPQYKMCCVYQKIPNESMTAQVGKCN